MGAPFRTFICGLLAPGLGYWIVNKRQYGLATIALIITIVLVLSWSRLLLEPMGYPVTIACLFAIQFGSALHAAFIESRGIEGDRGLRPAILFAVGATVILLLLFSFRGILLGYEAHRFPSQSMAPTFVRGDRIMVDTWQYKNSEPTSGDVVVFKAPRTGITYAKRIVGVPGDVISLQENQLTRNGEIINEPYAVYEGSAHSSRPFSNWSIPAGQFFLLGDNRHSSLDSRHFGTIPRENISGKVAYGF